MTYQLSRFRLASVGDRAARFTDLTLDLSPGLDGEPSDTILWLRNGGGKSSLLSLLFALLLPYWKDFMGKSMKRHLEDYIGSGDTSHTVAEWVTEVNGTPQRLITGAVYEWTERRKPVDPDRDRDKLQGRYYAFFAVPGVLDLDQLPIEDETGRRRSMLDFVRCLREIATARPRDAVLVVHDRNERRDWTSTLTARNLDPALFRYQKEMNHSEGGVADLFDFPTTARFIDFLIDLTVDTTQPDLVAANLRKIIDVLGRKPELLVDREFCAEVADRLDVLADSHRRAKAADVEASSARLAAARLAGAFRTSAAAQQLEAKRLAGEKERLAGEATSLDTERNRLNDAANELNRLAAIYRRAAAQSDWEIAGKSAASAKHENLAWEAVHWLAERTEAERAAVEVRKQLSEEEHKTAPLRAARDDAAAALKSHYAALVEQEVVAEEEATAVATEAETSAHREADAAQRHRDSATAAQVRVENLQGQVIEIEQAVDAAVENGDLPDADASPSAVLTGSRILQRDLDEQLGSVQARRAARPEERKTLQAEGSRLAAARIARIAEQDQVDTDRRRLVERVDELVADSRVAELLQIADGGRLNLWAEAADLRAALTHAAVTADAAIVDTRVDAADDDRALEGLRTDDFLPSTRDAQRAAEMLVRKTISARPGWELLRDLVAEPSRSGVLMNPQVAELAAGVVVADGDAEDAKALVLSGGWHAVAHVTVCTATQLEEALGSAAPPWCAVRSDPALFDPVAAESARTEREARRQEQDLRISVLRDEAIADRALLATMESLLLDCPAGHLDDLERAVAAADEEIEQSRMVERSVLDQIDQLDREEAADSQRQSDLSGELAVLAGKIERLSALAGRVFGLAGLRQTIVQLEKEAADHSGFAKAAEELVAGYRATERAARDRAAQHRSNRQRYATEAGRISLLDDDRAPVVSEAGESLPALQGRFAELDQQWHTAAAQSVLAERLNNLLARAGQAAQSLAAYESAVIGQAAELFETSDGQDGERRGAARIRSRAEADAAQGDLSRRKAELDAAQDEVEKRTPRGRARYAQLEVEPATESEARELAEREALRATDLSGKATRLKAEAGDAGVAATAAGTAARVFEQQANRLQDAAAPVVVPDDIPPYVEEDAEGALTEVLNHLNKAAGTAKATAEAADRAVGGVRRVAAGSRFAKIPDARRDRFTADDAEVLGERAALLAADLRLRRQTIEGQLADIGRDQHLVVVEVAAMVRDVLAMLESANRHSRLPGTLGNWGNEHFLRIRLTRPSSEEDLQLRIDSVIDRIVSEKSKPEGLSLLKRCVHESVAPRGFSVKVLKPNSDLAVEPVEVTQLGKFSGGEKLTVCVALYCTLARLRAVNRGQGKGALGGTLVLDNPLGTASHVALLRLQRDVAAAHGVQLVYTTGVEDLGAVGQFPNVLRLRNAPGALRTRRYVVLDEQQAADGITGARLSKTDEADGTEP
ncbi:hypothetical protein [Kribbella sp. NPDC023855]|uniref:hypothetical protein n=1 Tax=Kribbella sp. NPDC023855 TaxID=3154698 RepID=UPI0033D88D2D